MGNEKLLEEIGARISEMRKKRRMTQEELAERMDVSIQMISNLERGKKAVRPENIVKLCEVLNVSADYVLLGVVSENDIGNVIEKYRALSREKQEAVERIIALLSE